MGRWFLGTMVRKGRDVGQRYKLSYKIKISSGDWMYGRVIILNHTSVYTGNLLREEMSRSL